MAVLARSQINTSIVQTELCFNFIDYSFPAFRETIDLELALFIKNYASRIRL